MSYFTPAGSGGAVSNVIVEGSTNPTVATVSMALAGTEYSYVLPTNCKQFMIKLRGSGTLQFSYVSGESGTTYMEIPRYCFYAESDLNLNAATTLYFQSSSASQVAELIVWT